VNTISEQNAVGHYLDWTLPDIAADIQELMGGQVTPERVRPKTWTPTFRRISQ